MHIAQAGGFMLTRRNLGLAAWGALLGARPVRGQGTQPPLDALYAQFADEILHEAPERATTLGLDTGPRADLRFQLGQGSPAAIAQDKTATARRLRQLRAIGRAGLSGLPAVSYDTVLFTLETADEANRLFAYGPGGAHSPYVLSQLTGAYQSVPDFLDTQHKVETAQDADAYLARLAAFARLMDQEIEVFHKDAAAGVLPPDFIIDTTLVQMGVFLATPAEKATLVASLARRAAARGLDSSYAAAAASIYTGDILPALQRQADMLRAARKNAVHQAGACQLPKGEDFYRLGLKTYTTATLSPAEIHATGLNLVESLTAELDEKLHAQGFAHGSVGERLAALGADPRYLYENTDAGKEKLIADLNARVASMQAMLPTRFDTLPKSTVQIRRVPKAIEAGAPLGYYQRGSLDGTRPGAYYIDLRDTAEWASWKLPTLTYHEAIPGHHLQISLMQETPGLPLLRKMTSFSGYTEGWALYTEQLAVEMGIYAHDPLGLIGQLQASLFRAVRLVIDSGLHAQGWSREKAIDYYVAALGDKRSSAVSEVERYCVWPGQACSYMIGKLTWLRLRNLAKARLGARFDIKKFHDAGLVSGAVPLDVLSNVINAYAS